MTGININDYVINDPDGSEDGAAQCARLQQAIDAAEQLPEGERIVYVPHTFRMTGSARYGDRVLVKPSVSMVWLDPGNGSPLGLFTDVRLECWGDNRLLRPRMHRAMWMSNRPPTPTEDPNNPGQPYPSDIYAYTIIVGRDRGALAELADNVEIIDCDLSSDNGCDEIPIAFRASRHSAVRGGRIRMANKYDNSHACIGAAAVQDLLIDGLVYDAERHDKAEDDFINVTGWADHGGVLTWVGGVTVRNCRISGSTGFAASSRPDIPVYGLKFVNNELIRCRQILYLKDVLAGAETRGGVIDGVSCCHNLLTDDQGDSLRMVVDIAARGTATVPSVIRNVEIHDNQVVGPFWDPGAEAIGLALRLWAQEYATVSDIDVRGLHIQRGYRVSGTPAGGVRNAIHGRADDGGKVERVTVHNMALDEPVAAWPGLPVEIIENNGGTVDIAYSDLWVDGSEVP